MPSKDRITASEDANRMLTYLAVVRFVVMSFDLRYPRPLRRLLPYSHMIACTCFGLWGCWGVVELENWQKMLLVIPADAEHDPVSVSINRDLRQMMDSLSTPAGYSSGGRKRMMHKRMEHASQRAAAMGLDHDDKDGEALFSKNPPPSPRPSPMFPPLSMSATRMNKRLALQGSATSGTDFEMREAPELCAEETNLQKLFRRAHMGLAACARRLRLCSTERTAGQYVLWDSPMDQTRTRAVETNMTATGLAPLHETGDGYEEGTLKMRFPDSPYQTKAKADMVSKAARML